MYLEFRKNSFFFQVTEETIPIKDFPDTTCSVFWELWPSEKRVFVACCDKSALTFVFIRDSINGSIE